MARSRARRLTKILLLTIIHSLLTQVSPAAAPGPQKFSKQDPLRFYGFKLPKDYSNNNYNNWIHTKISHGSKNYTTGNLETNLDFNILPGMTDPGALIKYDSIIDSSNGDPPKPTDE